jgi:predicted enzyme related to lactoylglutathione lyase
MPGQEGQSAWCLYLASPDAATTAQKIRADGGEVLMEPMQVGDFGTMVIARDPSGVVFGVWQPGRHEGFEARGVPGAYCWAEVFTREPEKSDTFFSAVFGYRMKQLDDDAVDFRLYDLGKDPVLGRMRMTDDFPPEVPPYFNVYFTVEDCDAAVAKATERADEQPVRPLRRAERPTGRGVLRDRRQDHRGRDAQGDRRVLNGPRIAHGPAPPENGGIPPGRTRPFASRATMRMRYSSPLVVAARSNGRTPHKDCERKRPPAPHSLHFGRPSEHSSGPAA